MIYIEELIIKFLKKEISKKETETLKSWINENEDNLKVFKDSVKEFEKNNFENFDADLAYQKFLVKTDISKKKVINLRNYLKYAAILAGLIAIGYLYVNKNITPDISSDIVENEEKLNNKDITITLSDGSIKTIKNDENILDAYGNIIAHKNEGVVSFFNNESKESELKFSEIKVPNGEKLKIKLSDGSLVRLNSGSVLKFPESFSDSQKYRKVFLEGEAFFNITKNKNQPFIVNADNINIEVLGTEFNVSSYREDKNIKTTLVEGAVDVYTTDSPNEKFNLRPSYQAVYNKTDSTIEKNKVDTSIYTAWLDGKMIINNLKFPEILRKLERVYGVTFINDQEVFNDKTYKGEFTSEDIETVLKTISLSTPFNYKIEDNKIIILQ